jgi:serine/threonine protein kinase/tetratricopeptide (TPR) repeat protein
VDALRWDLNLAGQLSNPQATHVLDVWYTAEAITVVVEYLTGLSLGEALRRAAETHESVPQDLILMAALETARALEAAHDPQSPGGVVVHGDIRPENVLLGFEGSIKLTGFGFASFLPAASPDGGFCVWDGWCYQPPERFGLPDLDPRSDIFSLGVLMLEALSGAHPWGTQDPDLIRELLKTRSSPIPDEGVSLPADIAQVVGRACAIDPSARYQSVSELVEEIHGLLYARGRTGTSSALIRQYTGQFLDEDPDFDIDEEDPTVTSLQEPSGRSRFMEMSQQIPSYSPKIKTPEHPFVGRTDVLRIISQGLVGSSKGEGKAILLVATPGMGRTRLLTEVALRLSTSEHRRAWLHIKARPAERAIRFSSVLRLLAAPVGLKSDCDLLEVGKRADRLKALGLDDQMIETVQTVAGLGVPDDPARTTGLMSRALITCVSSVAHEQITIVAWDDLQWTDDGSLTCLGELVAELPVMPVMTLLTATTDFRPPWPTGVVLSVMLEPLSRDECEDLILELVPDAARVEPSLLQALMDHTGGNPLHLEETVNLLREERRLTIRSLFLERVGDHAAPMPRLEDSIRDRLEQMAPQVFTVALAAALAGSALREDVLIAATELPPHRVQQAIEALIAEHQLLIRGSAGLGFVHERQRRAVLSAVPAQAMEGLLERVAKAILDCTSAADGLDEVAASLLIRAGDPATAAEILFDTAEAQEEMGDSDGALQRFQWGLELARSDGTLGESFELHLCLGVGRTAFRALRFDVAETALMEAIDLANRSSDWVPQAEAEILLLQLFARQGRLQEAMERAKDAIPLAESTGDPLLLAQAYGAIGEAHQQWGQYGPDLRYIEAAVSFASESEDNALLGRFLQLAVIHAAGVGESEQTQLLLEQARPLAEANRDPWLQGELLKAEVLLNTFTGDIKSAIRKSLEGIELAHRHGLHELEVVMLHNVGDGNLRLERPREALYYFSESLRRSRAARYDRLTEANEMHIGYIEAVHLNQSGGIDRISNALKGAEQQGRIWNLHQGHLLLGRALHAQGRDDASKHLDEALDYAQQSGVRFFIDEAARWVEKAAAQG